MLEKERGRRLALMERYGVPFDKDMGAATEFGQRFPGKVTMKIGRMEHSRSGRRA